MLPGQELASVAMALCVRHAPALSGPVHELSNSASFSSMAARLT